MKDEMDLTSFTLHPVVGLGIKRILCPSTPPKTKQQATSETLIVDINFSEVCTVNIKQSPKAPCVCPEPNGFSSPCALIFLLLMLGLNTKLQKLFF